MTTIRIVEHFARESIAMSQAIKKNALNQLKINLTGKTLTIIDSWLDDNMDSIVESCGKIPYKFAKDRTIVFSEDDTVFIKSDPNDTEFYLMFNGIDYGFPLSEFVEV